MKKLLIFMFIFVFLNGFTIQYPEKLVELKKSKFTLYYYPDGKIPRYGIYTLEKVNVEKSPLKRRTYFPIDKQVKSMGLPYAKSSDYKSKLNGFIIDKGHTIGNNAFNDDLKAQKETFLMSNITPQFPRVNRIINKKYENYEILLAKKYNKIQVITGNCGKKFKLKKGEIVPKFYFHIIKAGNNVYYILFPNDKNIKKLNYFTNKDVIERVCKIKIK